MPATQCRTKKTTDRPVLQFFGDAEKMAKEHGVSRTHLSISHDQDFAIAHVILEKE